MNDDSKHLAHPLPSCCAACLLILLNAFISPHVVQAQDEDSFSIKSYVVFDSTVTITASRMLDIDDFIRMVRSDESLYRSFRNLRFTSYFFDTRMKMFSKNGDERASYESSARQRSDGKCRTMDLLSEESGGKFWKRRKKRKHRFYTGRMFERLFYTRDTVCEDRTAVWPRPREELSGMERYTEDLKTLIFSPGSPSSLPFVGDKTAIFSKKMAPFYDYTFRSTALNAEFSNCYEFRAEVKDKFRNRSKVIIQYFSTFFDKTTFQVVGRSYKLSDESQLYSFDVEMIIYIRSLGNDYYPNELMYKGYWNVPGKYPEIGWFRTRFYDFDIPD